MKMNKLLEKIYNINTKYVHLYFISKSDKKETFEVFSTKPDTDILSDIKADIHSQINDYISNDYNEPIDYDPIFEDKTIVQRIDCEELTLLPKFINKINITCPVYDEMDLKKGHKLWLVAIVMDDGEDKVLALQKIRSRTLLDSEKIGLAIDDKIKRVDRPILVLENKIDCICLLENNKLENQVMYIFHKYYFEQIFGFEEKFKRYVEKMLNEVEVGDDESITLNVDTLYSKIEKRKFFIRS